MALSSSGLGRKALNLETFGSNPASVTIKKSVNMKIEHVKIRQLLSVYLDQKYHNEDVLVVYVDDLLENLDNPSCKDFLAGVTDILGGSLPNIFILPGLCIFKMSKDMIGNILFRCNKAPLRLEWYHGGQCVSENR